MWPVSRLLVLPTDTWLVQCLCSEADGEDTRAETGAHAMLLRKGYTRSGDRQGLGTDEDTECGMPSESTMGFDNTLTSV